MSSSLGVQAVSRRFGPLTVTIHGQPATLIPDQVWASLAHGPYLSTGVSVEIVPRGLVRELWWRDQGAKSFPGDYAFRAYTRGNRVVLLSDATETPESLTWLLLHELAHVGVNASPYLQRAFRSRKRPAQYMTDDEAHERWPEEQLANHVADQLAPHFGSRPGLDRLWWRARVRRPRRVRQPFTSSR
jgi:hypothetical protein